jgi:hypothetical protein
MKNVWLLYWCAPFQAPELIAIFDSESKAREAEASGDWEHSTEYGHWWVDFRPVF